MPTQVLYGEQVEVLATRPGWDEIVVPDQPSPLNPIGYPGWVRSWQLSLTPLPAAHGSVTVTVKSVKLSNGTEVSFATRLPLIRRAGASDEVVTPFGPARIAVSAVAPLPVTRADLLFYERPVVGHVAMYIGGGLMIESPHSTSEVRIVPVSSRADQFRGARRFFG